MQQNCLEVVKGMSVVYGIDPGLKNCAIVKLTLDEKSFSISNMDLVDISKSLDKFHSYFRSQMLEEGDVYIEYQFRGGKVKDCSHHIHGYLTAMMNKKRVEMKQARDKFKVAETLGLMPQDHGDLKIYKNRKLCSETVMKSVLEKTRDDYFSKMSHKKKDDLADALLYALWAVSDRSPMSLFVLSSEAEKIQPRKEEKRIHISI